MENLNFRTDMADERVDEYKLVNNLSEIDGIKVDSVDKEDLKITTVDILNENGKNAVGKEIGRYITIEIKEIEYIEEEKKKEIIKSVADKINSVIKNNVKSLMVVGLGNEKVTPDSLGPKVISYINVTRHMLKYAKELVLPGTREISAISPGVLGTTGIETEEIIESITKFVKPDVLIVIDSLASQSVSRVGRTIQIGNTGITPGAGIGNKRKSLDKNTLGMDVIAIGVPLVVDMATITSDTIDEVAKTDSELKKQVTRIDKKDMYKIIANVLDEKNYIVTPKEIDAVVDKISDIIASSLNIVL